jgi:hypothetical protein
MVIFVNQRMIIHKYYRERKGVERKGGTKRRQVLPYFYYDFKIVLSNLAKKGERGYV